ncbi:putative ricin-type beta-trefoil [Lyophyllum shimeji]|uniref:Ricin-type beta-trefoil n=1 Tax=Lyophyllum shimeji TaxID=47721 RepID=A0A9P3Q0C5_LYOSH|nr:putative ricin-type beta-trefoil [Lyophyllum shimeji]
MVHRDPVAELVRFPTVTGVGDFTKINIRKGDAGGELDNRGADGRGNPSGGLVYGNTFGNGTQYHEWTSFISDNEFCFRACTGGDATVNCNPSMTLWAATANYDAGVFETCDGDNDLPMGVYGTSTWYQGCLAHPVPASRCVVLELPPPPYRHRSSRRSARWTTSAARSLGSPRSPPAPL